MEKNLFHASRFDFSAPERLNSRSGFFGKAGERRFARGRSERILLFQFWDAGVFIVILHMGTLLKRKLERYVSTASSHVCAAAFRVAEQGRADVAWI
jgi:hypothetical protein